MLQIRERLITTPNVIVGTGVLLFSLSATIGTLHLLSGSDSDINRRADSTSTSQQRDDRPKTEQPEKATLASADKPADYTQEPAGSSATQPSQTTIATPTATQSTQQPAPSEPATPKQSAAENNSQPNATQAQPAAPTPTATQPADDDKPLLTTLLSLPLLDIGFEVGR